MFKLIESITRDPVRFPVKPGVRLAPGHVVKVVEYEGNLVIDLCNGENPLGLLGNKCLGGNTIDFTKVAKIYLQRMVADVSKFDRENKINIGSSLYCNSIGELSSKKLHEQSIILAKVISPATVEKKYMQILWL